VLDLNIALIQTHLHWHNADANRQHFAEKIAPIKNADLIILPEMFTTGFTMDSATQAEAVDTVTLQWMQGIANKKRAVVTGSVATNTGLMAVLIIMINSICLAWPVNIMRMFLAKID